MNVGDEKQKRTLSCDRVAKSKIHTWSSKLRAALIKAFNEIAYLLNNEVCMNEFKFELSA